MSSALSSRHDHSQKTWWSISKPSTPPTSKDITRSFSEKSNSRQTPTKSSSAGLKFNAIATVMGFKAKKNPSLAIQEPPPLIHPSISPSSEVPPPHPGYTNRPPSKSVSSTQSRVDSVGPRTPTDGQRDVPNRHSLLTLSDTDPFAGRGMISPISSDPSRLSAYSNMSGSDYSMKKSDFSGLSAIYRGSYASTSSNSNYYNGDMVAPPQPAAPCPEPAVPIRKLVIKKSNGSLHRKASVVGNDPALATAWQNLANPSAATLPKSDSCSTLTDKPKIAHSASVGPTRPGTRARGMTDGNIKRAGTYTGGFMTHSSSSSKPASSSRPVSPRVIIRQASISRIGQPPSAPPRHELPPPPLVDNSEDRGSMKLNTSASSSSLSFVSPVSSNNEVSGQNFCSSPRQRAKQPAERSLSPFDTLGTDSPMVQSSHDSSRANTLPRTLKKSASHQTLGKRSSPLHVSTKVPPVELAPDPGPRKQRSFHPHIPIPPIPLPLRHANSFGSQVFSSPTNDTAISEQRRGSGAGLTTSTRKRLFSGSNHRRPSTSHGVASEDDSRSIFSFRSEIESSLSKSTSSVNHSSFWDEHMQDYAPLSPAASHSEYTPQQIMSPAEMAKVERSVEESSLYVRKRGLSIMSASTVASEREEGLNSNPYSSPGRDSIRGGTLSSRSSILSLGLQSTTSPSSSQSFTALTSPSRAYNTSLSTPSPTVTSLPPPPRPRQRPSIVTNVNVDPQTGITSLPPPPVRKHVRPKASIEKVLHRQSIMRKPSFLDIDDDTDRDTDLESTDKPLTGSFLDLARESFDSVRSDD